jgi:hypothetical protein
MPFTFLAHQAPVLPLKRWGPRAFDGTALVIGSMAPDLVYVLDGTSWEIDAHSVTGQIIWCLPLTVVLTWLLKRYVTPVVGTWLSGRRSGLLRGLAALGRWDARPSWHNGVVLVSSALIGSFSHIAFDGFTHPDGWAMNRLPQFESRAVTLPAAMSGRDMAMSTVLQILASVGGALVALWSLWRLARRLRVPNAPAPHRTALVAWPAVVGLLLGAGMGVVVAVLLDPAGGRAAFVIRVAAGTFAGLFVGCALLRGGQGFAPGPVVAPTIPGGEVVPGPPAGVTGDFDGTAPAVAVTGSGPTDLG